MVEAARSFKRILEAFPTHYPRNILEQAAIAGAFDPGRADADLQRVADEVAQRLDACRAGIRTRLAGADHARSRQFACPASCAGVEEIRTLDGAVLRSGEARKLSEVSREQPHGLCRSRAACPQGPRAS